MPLPDPYTDEPAVQVNEDLYRHWRELESFALQYAKAAEAAKALIIQQMGDAHAGLIGEDKVVTNRPTKRYATARIMSEREDLAQHFMHEVTNKVLDLEAFRIRHPEIAEKYRVRSFRVVGGGDE